ncbi:MAG: hypothetical protein EA380_09795 [Phycisphaeraceae bacterium]|nr:MAG: hypothetical protein EA380_09795 [Phycisphaeraceae bacterium]
MWLVLIIAVPIIYVTWSLLSDRSHHRQRANRLRRRPVLDRAEWDRCHAKGLDSDDSWIVAELLAGQLGCEASQVYPSDRFDMELVHKRGLGLDGDTATDMFTDSIEELIGGFRDDDRFETVGDVIKAVTERRGRDERNL